MEVYDQPLPLYEEIEVKDRSESIYYGIECFYSSNGRLFLQCDKYRDVYTIDTLPSGDAQVVAYAHDQSPAVVVGTISANSRILGIRWGSRTVVTVEQTFVVSHASGPCCLYSDFSYGGDAYLWRAKYHLRDGREHLSQCVLHKNGKLVAAFVTGQGELGHGKGDGKNSTRSLGNLFLQCYQAPWPTEPPAKLGQAGKFQRIGYHEKDGNADMMLVSFLAIWLRGLKESLSRKSHGVHVVG